MSASAIPLSRRRYKGWGKRLTIPPLSSAKTGKPSSRRTAFAAIRKKFATFSPAIRYGTPTTAAASVVVAALPDAQPVPAIASLTSPMMKIRSAANAVASGQAAWCRALVTWPAVMVFAKNPASVCATAPCIRSMTTKRATALNICASAAAAATIAARNTSNFL